MRPPQPKAHASDDNDEAWGPWLAPQDDMPAAPTSKAKAPTPPQGIKRGHEAIDDSLSEYIRSGEPTKETEQRGTHWKEKEQNWHKDKGDQQPRGRKQRGGWQHKARTRTGKAWQDWKRGQEGRPDRTWKHEPQ
eukprot:2367628-Amphidinium_carterae.1